MHIQFFIEPLVRYLEIDKHQWMCVKEFAQFSPLVSMSQKAVALGSVAGAAIAGSAWSYYQMSTTTERHPFILDGLRSAQIDPESMSPWRLAQVDSINNVGFATVRINDGRRVRITAKRCITENSNSTNTLNKEDSVYDDLDGEGSGLAFYWENPWEIKASIIRGVKLGLDKGRNFFSWTTTEPQGDEERWEVTSVSIDDSSVVGSRLAHPFFASHQIHNEAKSDESKKRAIYFISLLGLGASWILARRVYMNYRLWPAYVFARDYVQRHPVVVEFYQGKAPEIVARTGDLTRTKIDAEITITGGKDMLTESVVKFVASRRNEKSAWLVSRAILTPTGCKPIDLLVSRSLL